MNDNIELQALVIKIISENFKIDPDILEKNLDTNFVYQPYSFDYTDIVYLFLLILKSFNMKIDEEYLVNGSFKTINSIVNSIKLSNKRI